MYEVVWEDSALHELADLWTNADSVRRQAVTRATDAIDRRLSQDPAGQGESRDAGRRILFEFPLGIIFKVDEPQKTTRVLHVWILRANP